MEESTDFWMACLGIRVWVWARGNFQVQGYKAVVGLGFRDKRL